MTRIVAFVFSFVFLSTAVSAQVVYLRYDENCMNRYEYKTAADPDTYVSYTFGAGSNRIIHLDVGKEGIKWIKDVPGALTTCREFNIDRGVVDRINSGTLKIYMVRQSTTHYHLTQVDKATLVSLDGNEKLTVVMEDTEFSLFRNNLVANYNLSTPSSEKTVYLEGTISYQCLSGYIFRKIGKTGTTNVKEYIVLPEFGIVEKRAATGMGISSIGLKLEIIDQEDFSSLLKKRCGLPATTTDNLPGKDVPSGDAVVTYPTSYNTPSGPCTTSNRPGVHVVQKGETLYSLSRRYGISLNQLKNWNNIGADNLINECQELFVKSPSEVTSGAGTTMPGTTTTATTAGTGMADKGDGYWMSTSEMHEVKPGETVAALASMYGYTEARFRKMNSLGAYEKIYPGQKLFTNDCACPTLKSTTKDTPLPYDQQTPRLTSGGKPDVFFRPIKVHKVGKSESLFGIARLYDTTADRIMELNGLSKGAQLKEGQKLYVQ